MSRIDSAQVNKNRRLMEDSTVESPYVEQIGDSDADYGERLYDQLPGDRVGLMPSTEKKRKR